MNDTNKEMSINYSQTHILWDRNEIGDIDEIFSYSVASDIMSGDDDPEPKSVIDFQIRHDWDRWKDAINEKNDVTRYKARLVAQGFSQRPGIYEETYSPVMDAITFRFNQLSSLKKCRDASYGCCYNLLYGSLDNDINMKIPKGFKIPEASSSKPKEIYGEEVLGLEVSYLSAIEALMYIANYTRSDISFAVNLLERFNSFPHKKALEKNQTHFSISSRNC
ncbi:putative RNA-directed DNA polymerase [Tanacetum coccineum]|uniref:RNA-directed DNA polymerase n=1 Tax=Tanacetum coccineum TaxID=301880 RepID=A0ABQ5DQM9_9ASTR